MSNWSIIQTRALVEAEDLLAEVFDSDNQIEQNEILTEIKKLINEAVSCNVKPEAFA